MNAFLTKPFSSQQLIETIRTGIRTFELQKQRQCDHIWTYRKLLQALMTDRTTPLTDLRLCNGLIPIEHLQCTQVEFTELNLGDLPLNTRKSLEQYIYAVVEEDTPQQSCFLLECSQDTLQILVFSKESPQVAWETDLIQILSTKTGTLPHSTKKNISLF